MEPIKHTTQRRQLGIPNNKVINIEIVGESIDHKVQCNKG